MADEKYHTEIKRVPNEGKVKRWMVNPIKRLATWKIEDPKKDRVSA